MLAIIAPSFSQDKLTLKGYIKYLNIVTPAPDLNNIITDNFFHNRLNFRYYPTSALSAGVEVRTRVFYGEATRLNPLLSNNLEMDNSGLFDLSSVWIDETSFKAHTIIDRAWIDWYKGKVQARIGRQRINWGVNTVWNPNDLFNSYSFFDFDYEERPGSDAIRLQYYTGVASGFDIAARPGKRAKDDVIAGIYRFNKWQYDFQVLSGIFHSDVAIGTGWAGNIGTGGFKGEATYFHPYENFSDTSGIFVASFTLDYSFKNGIYILGSYLYSGAASSSALQLSNFVNVQLTPKTLSPFEHSTLVQVSGNITPLVNGGIAFIFYPGNNYFFSGPSLTFSLAPNLDLLLTSQVVFGDKPNGNFGGLGGSFYMRVKKSF